MSYVKAYAVALVSLMCGASVVHLVYKPDLVRSRISPGYIAGLLVCCPGW